MLRLHFLLYNGARYSSTRVVINKPSVSSSGPSPESSKYVKIQANERRTKTARTHQNSNSRSRPASRNNSSDNTINISRSIRSHKVHTENTKQTQQQFVEQEQLTKEKQNQTLELLERQKWKIFIENYEQDANNNHSYSRDYDEKVSKISLYGKFTNKVDLSKIISPKIDLVKSRNLKNFSRTNSGTAEFDEFIDTVMGKEQEKEKSLSEENQVKESQRQLDEYLENTEYELYNFQVVDLDFTASKLSSNDSSFTVVLPRIIANNVRFLDLVENENYLKIDGHLITGG